jgi:hypothetical protein
MNFAASQYANAGGLGFMPLYQSFLRESTGFAWAVVNVF